ncbi:MAG: glycosyltransferase family 1 protein [Planctomycetota bacterium]
MPRRRLLVDASTLDGSPTGAATRLRELYRAYAEAFGLDDLVFLVDVSRTAARHCLPAGAAFIERRCPRTPTERLLAGSVFFASLVDELSLRAVHVEGLPPPTLDVPVLVTVHDLRFRSPVEKSGARRAYASFLLRERLRRSVVITISRCMHGEIEAWLAPAAEHLWLVPNAAVAPAGPPSPVATGAHVLVIGHLEQRKAPDTALRAFALFSTAAPGARLIFAGDGKPDVKVRLSRLAEQLAVRARVELRGSVSDADKWQLLRSAFALLAPSRYEGFGFAPLEAMAARTPAVVSDIAAHREVCGAAALYAPLDDAPAFAALLAQLADTSVRAQLIERGLERVRRSSWRDSARALHDVYQRW